MPARNRNPIQMSKVSLACLALLVAVCGGYFALVPFLQAIEPSVLGVQVAYAGYFTPLAIELGAVIPLVEGT